MDFASIAIIISAILVLGGANVLLIYSARKEIKKKLKFSLNTTCNQKEFDLLASQYFLDQNKKNKSNVNCFYIKISNLQKISSEIGELEFSYLTKEIVSRIEQVMSNKIKCLCQTQNCEFIILTAKFLTENEIKELCEFLILEISRPVILADGFKQKLELNIASANFDYVSNYDKLKEIIELNITKQSNQRTNTYNIINKELLLENSEQFKYYNELINALDHREFLIYFSPVLDLSTQNIIAFESIFKWNRNGKLLDQQNFIDILEKASSVTNMKIMLWGYQEILKQRKKWEVAFESKNFEIFFPIFPSQIVQSTLIDDLRQITRQYNFSNKKLTFKIQDWDQINQSEKMKNNMKFLQKMSYEVLLDNYELLTNFSKFNDEKINSVKIDCKRLYEVEENPLYKQIFDVFSSFCNKQSIRIIASNVKTQQDFELVKKYNILFIQGVAVSQELVAGEFKKLRIESLNFVKEKSKKKSLQTKLEGDSQEEVKEMQVQENTQSQTQSEIQINQSDSDTQNQEQDGQDETINKILNNVENSSNDITNTKQSENIDNTIENNNNSSLNEESQQKENLKSKRTKTKKE